MQRIGQNGGLCHGEQKANLPYNSTKNSLKISVVVVVTDSELRIYQISKTI